MNILKKQLVAIAGALLMFGAASTSHAAWAIDTGTPNGPNELELSGAQSLAGQINFTGARQIRAIETYVNDQGLGGSFMIALYSDTAGHLPGALLNSWSATFSTTSNQYGWNGVSNLAFDVAAGTYWIALEVPDFSFSGLALDGAPAPLANYAFNASFAYQQMPNQIGFRVDAVPEPETYAMLLAGLGLLGWAGRRSKQKAV